MEEDRDGRNVHGYITTTTTTTTTTTPTTTTTTTTTTATATTPIILLLTPTILIPTILIIHITKHHPPPHPHHHKKRKDKGTWSKKCGVERQSVQVIRITIMTDTESAGGHTRHARRWHTVITARCIWILH